MKPSSRMRRSTYARRPVGELRVDDRVVDAKAPCGTPAMVAASATVSSSSVLPKNVSAAAATP